MKKLLVSIFAVGFAVLLLNDLSFAQDTQDKISNTNYNIEGVFTCDWNGTYYVRQIGNEVLWYGEEVSVDPSWSNVAHGTINGDVLTLIWADVPKGSIMQKGNLVIKINSNDNFILTTQEGDHFGSSVWTRKTN